MAEHSSPDPSPPDPSPAEPSTSTGLEVAIIGLAGRFPGASSVDTFWENLRNRVESISSFSDEELAASGIDPAIFRAPEYVNARGLLENADCFDADFFGYYPREAELLDPQQRVFLECAWEALESAGYDPQGCRAPIGVYAGSAQNTYRMNNLAPNASLMREGGLQVKVANDENFLATRVSYKLDLSGPSVSVQTACSTSLVAVHLACQALLTGECDMALAGGSSISAPLNAGHVYDEDSILSPDGHCRTFDVKAKGTLRGDGVGIVLLKRLADALEDRDPIWAVIRGSAINNDGSAKVGFTAPSVTGQVSCIERALTMAEVDPATLGLIEAHGTATPLGDPIEVAALTEVFRASTQRRQFCALGSVKTNLGHLDAAAGVAGLIKAVLAVKHAKLPASLHFEEANPKLELSTSPFYVNTELSDWPSDGVPRRAGVNSFGIGGTNAHVVLEQAPSPSPSGPSRPWQLLVLSARTPAALETATQNLRSYLQAHPSLPLADVAYTLQTGRRRFLHRRMLVCRDMADAIEQLESLDPRRVSTRGPSDGEPSVAFLFPGQGSQFVDMGRELYESEPLFRKHVDDCCDRLQPSLGLDLRSVLYPAEVDAEASTLQLKQTAVAQPALFVIEYALARLWMSWGVEPAAMLGHSIGEYPAACLAGVFSLEDALELVVTRGRLMQEQPAGSMIAVPLAEAELRPRLKPSLSLAAVNAPSLCVVSGPSEVVEAFEAELRRDGIDATHLHTSHAFHSGMMDPILGPFQERVRDVRLATPRTPCISNVSGTWLSDAEATDPAYWARHIRRTVEFSKGVGALSEPAGRVLLEVGPGRTLVTLAAQRAAQPTESRDGAELVRSMRHPGEPQSDLVLMLTALGRLWLSGVEVDWPGFHANETRQRIPLPSYPFARKRYWVEPPGREQASSVHRAHVGKRPDVADWFYVPSWRRSRPPARPAGTANLSGSSWLVFLDESGLGAGLVERLKDLGLAVVSVSAGASFSESGDSDYTIEPGCRTNYARLIEALTSRDACPDRIVHLWGVTPHDEAEPGALDRALARGFYSLLFLAQALSPHIPEDSVHLAVVTSAAQDVTGQERLCPEKAMALGPCKVIPQEHPNVSCRSVDLVLPDSGARGAPRVDQLLLECDVERNDPVVAYRGEYRWVQGFESVRFDSPSESGSRLRESGVYLVTGGFGRIGLELAEHLADRVAARLVLVGRSVPPRREEWEDWLVEHGEADAVSRKIRRLQKIEERGGEVVVESADVADLESMRGVAERAREKFGAIHGVIHAAASTRAESFHFIQEAGEEDCEDQFRPKVHGMQVLEELFRGEPLDFFALFSSLSSVLGGFEFAAYSATNLFLDAFAQQQARSSDVPWLSMGWDGWKFERDGEGRSEIGASLADAAMTPPEGLDAFERVLCGDDVHVLVSTSDLHARIEEWIELESLRASDSAAAAEAPTAYARPDLATEYVAPRTDLERTISDTWGELLGIERVGIYDNFFELGGHSLLGTQLISRLRKEFRVELRLRQLLDGPTVADLGVSIVQLQAQQADDGTLAALLAELEDLSDEGVSAALSDEENEASGGDSDVQ